MSEEKNHISVLKDLVDKEKKIASEMSILYGNLDKVKAIEERKLIISHLVKLKNSVNDINNNIPPLLEKISLTKALPVTSKQPLPSSPRPKTKTTYEIAENKHAANKLSKRLRELERTTLKRIAKKEKKVRKIKPKTPSMYVKTSNQLFSRFAISLIKKGRFRTLERNLVKSNLQILPKSYVSVIFFTSMLAFIGAILLFIFLMFFNISIESPFVTMISESLGARFLKVFWVIFVIPLATYILMYAYPSMEKKSLESKLDQELPFATIHMAAISGSLVEPSKIFSIIISTAEYPNLQKEFIKLMNEINIFGHDIVTALRNISYNSPSKKLSELFNGLATTITSGGNLPEFFEKRATSLLFDYRLEREKYTKTAETFMDIYISVVIAAPMILMLLLIMMKISGLGISLSTQMISLLMVIGVSLINVLFLTFLQMKQPTS